MVVGRSREGSENKMRKIEEMLRIETKVYFSSGNQAQHRMR